METKMRQALKVLGDGVDDPDYLGGLQLAHR